MGAIVSTLFCSPCMFLPSKDILAVQDCLEMQDIGEDLAGLPDGADQIPGPRVQRQVLAQPFCTAQ